MEPDPRMESLIRINSPCRVRELFGRRTAWEFHWPARTHDSRDCTQSFPSLISAPLSSSIILSCIESISAPTLVVLAIHRSRALTHHAAPKLSISSISYTPSCKRLPAFTISSFTLMSAPDACSQETTRTQCGGQIRGNAQLKARVF
jgi:hypothetical protein